MKQNKIEFSDLISNIEIREGIRDFAPTLLSSELAQLKASIIKEGIRDPLVFWFSDGKYILIDGHHRYAIILELNIPFFPFKVIEAIDEHEIGLWILENILSKRRLTSLQFSYLRGQQYLLEKNSKSKNLSLQENGQNVHPQNTTAERLGSIYSVSGKTILRDADLVNGLEQLSQVDPTLKGKVLNGNRRIEKSILQGIAQGKIIAEEFLSTQFVPVPKKKRPSASEVARQAFSYVCTERKPLDEVMKLLKINGSIEPIDFFQSWYKMNS